MGGCSCRVSLASRAHSVECRGDRGSKGEWSEWLKEDWHGAKSVTGWWSSLAI